MRVFLASAMEGPVSGQGLIRAMCFGDSLTEGLFNWSFFPYADLLLEVSSGRIEGQAFGVSGELSGEVLRRLREGLDLLSAGDYVPILAGTNDVARQPEDVDGALANIREMAELAESAAARPLLITIPALGRGRVGGSMRVECDQVRATLNTEILQLASSRAWPVVDLWRETSLEMEPEADASHSEPEMSPEPPRVRVLMSEFDGDGLHFNPAGYRRLAELVATAILADSQNVLL